MSRTLQRKGALTATFILLLIMALVTFTPHGETIRSYAPAIGAYTAASFNSQPSITTTQAAESAEKEQGEERVEGVVMPKLLNETAKAELGRHAWYLFHTVLARFPMEPTEGERQDLGVWVEYFTKLYPCGDCAAHFQSVLKDFPVQSSSRIAAAQWGCAVHNRVNERIGKVDYDCSKVLEDYDCGCGT